MEHYSIRIHHYKLLLHGGPEGYSSGHRQSNREESRRIMQLPPDTKMLLMETGSDSFCQLCPRNTRGINYSEDIVNRIGQKLCDPNSPAGIVLEQQCLSFMENNMGITNFTVGELLKYQ